MTRPSATANGPRNPAPASLPIAAAKSARHLVPGSRASAGCGKTPNRIEAGAQIDRSGGDALACDEFRQVASDASRLRGKIKVDGDTGCKIDAVKQARQRHRRLEAVTVGAYRAGKDQHQPGCAVAQFVSSLSVGRCRVGMIDALHQCPSGARGAAGDGARGRGAVIERLNCQAVVSFALKPLKWRALERAIDQPAPLVMGRGREICGKGKRLGGCHRGKMPCLAGQGQWSLPCNCHAVRKVITAAVSRCRLRPTGRAHRAPGCRQSCAPVQFRQAAPRRRRARTGADAAASGLGP